MKKVIIIGSGFSGLSAACYMAKEGYEVTVYEKNNTLGGRARQFKREGFTFDMGPTFYWMPDIFENFFADFKTKPADLYELIRLNPGYEIYFGKQNRLSLSSDKGKILELFEKTEKGSSLFLEHFLKQAAYNYKVAIQKIVYKPGKSLAELVMPETISRIPQFICSLHHTVRNHIQDPRLRQILEFPVLFLGAKPSETPSFYRFMNYADMELGTWHIKGGMFMLIKSMQTVAESLGVKIYPNSPVDKIVTENQQVTGVLIKDIFHPADVVISGADYQHTESLLEASVRNYKETYWNKKTFAPSALLYYIGFDKQLKNVSHHTLFFDTDFDRHAKAIYDQPDWPEKPLFYASFPTKTDPTLAPDGKEAAIILLPVAAGLADTPALREYYFKQVIERMEELTGQSLTDDILFHHSYSVSDFQRDYHAYKGNAYGLANTLFQTAFFKPKIYNRKLKDLFYTGQLTVPGPGVPPALISGKIAAKEAISYLRQRV